MALDFFKALKIICSSVDIFDKVCSLGHRLWPLCRSDTLRRHICRDYKRSEMPCETQIFCSFGVDVLEALSATCTAFATGDPHRCGHRP